MAHKGTLIYSVLWCNTAESDTSKGAGRVRSHRNHMQQREAENLVSDTEIPSALIKLGKKE